MLMITDFGRDAKNTNVTVFSPLCEPTDAIVEVLSVILILFFSLSFVMYMLRSGSKLGQY